MGTKHLMDRQQVLKQIGNVQKEISEKSFNKSVQIGLFLFVVCIMLFFLAFFVMDMLHVLKVYFQKRRNIESKEKIYMVDDNNDYNTSGIEYENELDVIEDQIVKRNTNLEHRVREMVEWKKSNKIPNVKIESKIDMSVLESKFDNYDYVKNNNGDSFWKMIFMPPKYYDLVNNKARPYYRLIKDE
jgi:hypothetical protein